MLEASLDVVRLLGFGKLDRQLIEQRLRFPQVGGVEALGEPVVDVGEPNCSAHA